MKKYKVAHLNKGLRLSRQKDIEVMEETINDLASEGWELMQVVSPCDAVGAVIGIFKKEEITY